MKAVFFFFFANDEELFAFYQDSWEQTVSFKAIAISKEKFAFYWQIHLGEGLYFGSMGRNHFSFFHACGRLLCLSYGCFSLDCHEYFIPLRTG